MTKTNNNNTLEISVRQETGLSRIPVHIQRGVGGYALRGSNKPLYDRRQDHGTKGNGHIADANYGRPKSDLVEEAIDVVNGLDLEDTDGPDIDTNKDSQDFAIWQRQMDDTPLLLEIDDELVWSTETPANITDIKPVIDWVAIDDDLEKVNKTKKQIKEMNDEELEDFKQWLFRRARKS